MNPSDIFQELAAYGEANLNPDNIRKYLRYFKEGFDSYGLSSEQLAGRVEWILSLPGMNQEKVRAITLTLVKSPKYEMRIIAVKLMQHFRKSWSEADFRTVEKWFSLGISNWAETDVICGELMNLFFSKKIVALKDLETGRNAPNKFQRRAAVVSLIKPMKLSDGNFREYYRFIEPLMHDPDREVHQGLGWFLRETWKKQPSQAEEFLLKYKETAPRLIFQYATEKMMKEGKERFRREKRSDR